MENDMVDLDEYIKCLMNVFMVWLWIEWCKFVFKYLNMLNCEISKLLGVEWSCLSDEEKKFFVMEVKWFWLIYS